MRTPWVVGIVVAAHCAAIGGIVLFQGCSTVQPVPDPPSEVVLPPSGGRVEGTASLPPSLPPETAPEMRSWDDVTTTYVVGRGDSLSKIAARFGLSVNEIVSLNGISDPNKIRVGQKLILPGKVDAESVPSPRSTSAPIAVPEGGSVYVVRPGDCLSALASRFSTTSAAIRNANGITGDMIRVGQKLVIPGMSGDAMPAPAPTRSAPGRSVVTPPRPAPVFPEVPLDSAPVDEAPVSMAPAADAEAIATPVLPARPTSSGSLSFKIHTVEPGEDLYSVAMMWGVSVQRIKDLNNLTDVAVEPGKKLKIPLNE